MSDAKADKNASSQATHFHLLKCKRAFVLVFAFYSYRPGKNKRKREVKIARGTGAMFSRFSGERSTKPASSAGARDTRNGKRRVPRLPC